MSLKQLKREDRKAKKLLKNYYKKYKKHACSLEELYAAYDKESPIEGIDGSEAVVRARRQEREKYNW